MSLLVLFPSQEAQPQAVTGTAVFAQIATWSGTASEKISGTASASQVQTFAAAGSERLTGIAVFVQAAAAWNGTGSSVLTISGTSAFSQAAAAWAATGSSAQSSMTGTAAFTQAVAASGLSGTVSLKILGYASPTMPESYATTVGLPPPGIESP